MSSRIRGVSPLAELICVRWRGCNGKFSGVGAAMNKIMGKDMNLDHIAGENVAGQFVACVIIRSWFPIRLSLPNGNKGIAFTGQVKRFFPVPAPLVRLVELVTPSDTADSRK